MRNLWYFFKNIWRYRKALWQYREWDYSYVYAFHLTHLETLEDSIRNAYMPSVNDANYLKRIREMKALVKRIQAGDHHLMYHTFNHQMKCKQLDNGMVEVLDLGVRDKAGVNHKRVNAEKQLKQDIERYHYLLTKYSRSLWT